MTEHIRAGLGAEWLKMRGRSAVWLVLAVWIGLALLFVYALPYIKAKSTAAAAVPPALLPSHLAGTVLTECSFWGGALVLILGAMWIGSEFGWGTYRTLFSQRPARAAVLLSQVGVLLLCVAGLVAAAFAVSAVASEVVAGPASLPSTLPSAGALLGAAAAAWLILAMWAAFGAFLAVVTSGTALSIGLGIVWALGVENVLRAFTGAIPLLAAIDKAFPGASAAVVIAAVGGSATPGVAPAQAYAIVALYLVAFVLAMCAVLARRDVA